MKFRFPLFLACSLVTFSPCHKEKPDRNVICYQVDKSIDQGNERTGAICASDLCVTYQGIWKELILQKNILSKNYFQNHIVVQSSNINSWDDGISFIVCYKVQIDWAEVDICDQFIIKINTGNSFYPALNLPREEYLLKEDIQKVVKNRAFSSHIVNLSIDFLALSSKMKAMERLIAKAKVNTLCPGGFVINESTGHISLIGSGQYQNESNLCVDGIIDLINGSTRIIDSPCLIY